MINVAQARAELAKIEGENFVIPKAQYAELIRQVELGNVARVRLTNIRTIVNTGAAAVEIDR